MNRIQILLALAIMILTSCEQPTIPNESMGDPNGNLFVSVFQIEQQSFGAPLTRAVIADYCTHLNFAVYDADGKLVKQLNQEASQTGFGAVSFSVAAGTYQVVVVGHSSSGNPTMTNSQKIQFTNSDGYSDTFLYSTQVEMADEDDEVEVSADLRRIVSLCRVTFTDAIPEDVTQIQFQYKGGSGAFDASTGYGTVKSTQKVTFPVQAGTESNTFDLYTFLHDDEGTIQLQITAQDDNKNRIRNRDFEVPMKQRVITKLSGPYFSGSSGSSISIVIGINTEWEGEQDITFD